MGIRGPNPKPNRRNRTPLTHDWIEVEDTPNTSGPQLPARRRNGRKWPAHAVARWQAWCALPHTKLWQRSDWEFALDTLELVARANDGAAVSLLSEIRLREKAMGTTWDSRQGMRIRYVEPSASGDVAEVMDLSGYRDL